MDLTPEEVCGLCDDSANLDAEFNYADNDFDTYQEATRKHISYPQDSAQWTSLDYLLYGLASETGEVLGKYKKYIREDYEDLPVEDIRAELGDVMWYIARIHDELGLSMYETSLMNLEKLDSRVARDVVKGDGDNR